MSKSLSSQKSLTYHKCFGVGSKLFSKGFEPTESFDPSSSTSPQVTFMSVVLLFTPGGVIGPRVDQGAG